MRNLSSLIMVVLAVPLRGAAAVNDCLDSTRPDCQAADDTACNRCNVNYPTFVPAIAQTVPHGSLILNDCGLVDDDFADMNACVQAAADAATAGGFSVVRVDISDNPQLSSLPETIFGPVASTILNIFLLSNGFEALPGMLFAGFSVLTNVDIQFNPSLTTLPPGFFDPIGKASLSKLSLFNNGLVSLPENIFQDFEDLTTFDLRSNDLKTFRAGTFLQISSILEPFLEGNGMECRPEYNPGLFGFIYDIPAGSICGCTLADGNDACGQDEVCTPSPVGFVCDPAPPGTPVTCPAEGAGTGEIQCLAGETYVGGTCAAPGPCGETDCCAVECTDPVCDGDYVFVGGTCGAGPCEADDCCVDSCTFSEGACGENCGTGCADVCASLGVDFVTNKQCSGVGNKNGENTYCQAEGLNTCCTCDEYV